jgi:hypothetical protein
LRADIRDRQRVVSQVVFHPFTTHHFFSGAQTEHAFIKGTGALHVGHRNADEGQRLNFDLHDAFREISQGFLRNPKSQIPGKSQSRNRGKKEIITRCSSK